MDLDEGREEVPLGEPGEIILKSPAVMPGYWDNPEETANQIRDGWIYCGDVATMDEDGYLYLVGRKKDMIIAGGYNIYPREIDQAPAIWLPGPYLYVAWWPWVKNYYGELSVGAWRPGPIFARIWVLEDLFDYFLILYHAYGLHPAGAFGR